MIKYKQIIVNFLKECIVRSSGDISTNSSCGILLFHEKLKTFGLI